MSEVTRAIDRLKLYKQIDVNSCWNYTGSLRSNGYGRVYFNGKDIKLNRFIAFVVWGLDLNNQDIHVKHTCDNRKCFNPLHLKLGTRYENTQDAIDRDRMGSKRKEYCVNGHDMSINRFVNNRGNTRCKTCHRLATVRKDNKRRLDRKNAR